MTEKEVIAKIQKLEQIGPEKDWILATKTQILGVDATATPFFVFSSQRLAFAGLLVLLLLVGVFGFAQNSLPGDFLYPVKKMTERGQEVFVSETDKPKLKLELANKRLDELTRVAETNKVKKLAPAIKEFEASILEAAKELVLSLPEDFDKSKRAEVEEILEETVRPPTAKSIVRAREKGKEEKYKAPDQRAVWLWGETQGKTSMSNWIAKNKLSDVLSVTPEHMREDVFNFIDDLKHWIKEAKL